MFNTKNPKTATLPEASITSPRPKPRVTTNNTQRLSATSSQEKTTISQGYFIKGEISGTDDISVFGKVDGTILLKKNILTIEKLSDVKASIEAKVVNIIGRVVGNINANEKIIIHERGSVTGDMDAPKVILKDGSYFKGSVSMTENKKIEPTTTKEESKTQTNKLV
jgi:cytoskeletal protein CcmA (bactofilin family)